jgi:hypothetical protein
MTFCGGNATFQFLKKSGSFSDNESMNPTVLWLLLGAGLCLVEFILPTAFIAFVMGLSAFLVAIVAHLLPVSLQVLLWVVFSIALVFSPFGESPCGIQAGCE